MPSNLNQRPKAESAMPLHSLIAWISSSNLLFLILSFLNMSRVSTRRKVSEDEQVSCSVSRDVEMKDDVKSPGVDLISNLPCSIIHSILGQLDLDDVMKMSVLSREWRHNFLAYPELVFNSRFNQKLLRSQSLKTFIHRILSLRQGPLLKFAVQVSDLKSCPEIDEWIHLLPGDTLQDLSLQINIGEKHKLTSHLFTLQNLRNLNLCNCVLDPPRGFTGFNKLVNFELQNSGLVLERFGELICSCPALESLTMIHCTKFDHLEITGPKLKFLDFVGVFRSVSFTNCPVLSDIRLTLTCLDVCSFDLVKSLSCFLKLEELHLQAHALEDLVRYNAPAKLPVALKSLKNLHVMDMYFEKPAEASCAISFIRSCPDLQKLKITGFTSQAVDLDSVAKSLQQVETRESLIGLRRVEMLGFCGIKSEMEFVKFLLVSAEVLEEMRISPHGGVVSDGGESILMELKQYPRASPRVEITNANWGSRKGKEHV